MAKVKIQYIIQKSHPDLEWDMTTGITQEVEVSPFGGGWIVKGGGWEGYGGTQNLAQLNWLRSRLSDDRMGY